MRIDDVKVGETYVKGYRGAYGLPGRRLKVTGITTEPQRFYTRMRSTTRLVRRIQVETVNPVTGESYPEPKGWADMTSWERQRHQDAPHTGIVTGAALERPWTDADSERERQRRETNRASIEAQGRVLAALDHLLVDHAWSVRRNGRVTLSLEIPFKDADNFDTFVATLQREGTLRRADEASVMRAEEDS